MALLKSTRSVNSILNNFTRLLRHYSEKSIKPIDSIPTITKGGIAFENDLRGTSGVGLGDGLESHTDKWLQGDFKSPMEYANEIIPKKVKGLKVASHGTEDPGLGCPVEYLDLRGTSYDNPAICKYTGDKYYSDDWIDNATSH